MPYSPQSDMLMDTDLLATMKRGAFPASCGSGSAIDEAALAAALRAGHASGAALDAFEWPRILPENPCSRGTDPCMKVVLTPHTAARSGERVSSE